MLPEPQPWATDASQKTYSRFLADANHDGKADAIWYEQSAREWWVAKSTGIGFGTPTLWHQSSVENPDTLLVGDVNGDRDADVVTFKADDDAGGPVGWFVALANSSQDEFGPTDQLWTSSTDMGDDQALGDVDGDESLDVITYHSADGEWKLWRSTGVSFSAAGTLMETFGPGADQNVIGDLNGDGKDDAVAVHDGYRTWYGVKSTGSRFVLYNKGAYGSTQTFPVGANETSVAFECAIDNATFTPCDGSYTASSLSDGAHTIHLRGRDDAGNESQTTDRIFKVDTSPPSVGIASPQGFVSTATPALGMWVTDATGVASVTCTIDGGTAFTCANGQTLSSLSEGQHTITITMTDVIGNASTTAPAQFTVDTTAPALTVSGLAGQFYRASGEYYTLPWSGVAATDANGIASTQCVVDGQTNVWVDNCRYGAHGFLPDGQHSLVVVVRDPAGNATSSAPQQFTLTTNGTMPTVDVTAPTGRTNGAGLVLDFTASSPIGISATTCSIDGGATFSCSDGQMLPALAEGSHTVVVQAQDSAGSIASDTTTIDVDATAPAVTVHYPRDIVGITTPEVFFAVAEYGNPPVATTCAIDGGTPFACASGQTLSALSAGEHTVVVSATDTVGNAGSGSSSFTVNTDAPTVTITGPTGTVGTNEPRVNWQVVTQTGYTGSTCSVDGGVPFTCSNGLRLPVLSEGPHTVIVTVTDSFGNVGTSAPASFVVKSPTLTITSPTHTVATSPVLHYTTTDVNAVVNTYCSIDGGSMFGCADGNSFPTPSSGDHTLQLTTVNSVGDSYTATTDFTVDLTPPTLTINGPSGLVTPTPQLDVTTFDASGEVTLKCRVNGGIWFTCVDDETLSIPGVAQNDVDVMATDIAGNVAYASTEIFVDATPPSLTISGPRGFTDATPAVMFATSYASPTAPKMCSLDDGPPFVCNSGDELPTLAAGEHTVTVSAVDVAGNETMESTNFVVDLSPPSVVITGPSGTVETDTPHLDWFVSDPSGYTSATCSIDGGTPYECSGGNQTAPLLAGTHTFTITAIDGVGNAGTSTSQSFDVVLPSLIVTAPAGYVSDRVVHFTASDPDDVVYRTCSVDGGTAFGCQDGQTLPFLAEGEHTLLVALRNSWFYTYSASSEFVYDATNPSVAIQSPSGLVGSSTPQLQFTATDENGIGSTTCAIDGGNPFVCASGEDLPNVGAGSHTIVVTVRDAANNAATNSSTFIVDAQAPTVTLAYPGPGSTVSSSTVNATFSANEPASFRCKIDDGSFDLCTSPTQYTGLANGSHTITVEATDSAGNVGVATAAFTVATTIKINFQPTDAGSYAGYLVDSGAVFGDRGNGYSYGWSQSETANTRLRTNTGTSDLRYNTLVGLGYTQSASWKIALPNGQYLARVVAGDPTYPGAVNLTANGTTVINGTTTSSNKWIDNTVSATVSNGFLTIAQGGGSTNNIDFIEVTTGADTAAPTVTITVPASGSAVTSSTVNASFSASESVTFQCSLDSGLFSSCASPRQYASLSDGPHTITVQATDASGNVGSGVTTFTVDTLEPDTSFAAGPIEGSTISVPTATFEFSSPDTTASFQCKVDEGSYVACTSSYTTPTLANGTHTIYVRAVDPTGNVDPTPSSRSFTVATVATTIKINFQPTDAGSYAGYLVDSGAVFGDRGNGYSYGWSQSETANTRLRTNTGTSDLRYNTLVGLGYTQSASWKVALPNGQYLGPIPEGLRSPALNF